jgi:hypothetical protein
MAKTFPLRLSDELRAEIDRDVERIRKDNPKFSLNDWLIGAAKRQLAFADGSYVAKFPPLSDEQRAAMTTAVEYEVSANPPASPKPKRAKLKPSPGITPLMAESRERAKARASMPDGLPLSEQMLWRRVHGV